MGNDPKSNETKSSKFAGAVNRATGQEMAVTDGKGAVDLGKYFGAGDHASLIKSHGEDGKAASASLDALVNSKEWEFAPQLFKMAQNDEVSGILEGNGPPAEFERTDATTGIITTNVVQTWIVASLDGTKRVSILSSVQLDRKLPPFVGGPVKIFRGKDININNGQRVTDYAVAGPKLSEGKRREWATRPVLDAVSEAKQLPEGGQQHEDLLASGQHNNAPASQPVAS